MGAERFHDTVDSVGQQVKRLERSSDPQLREVAAKGRPKYHALASWKAGFIRTYADAIHHADSVERLLGDQDDPKARGMRISSVGARMAVFSGIGDTR